MTELSSLERRGLLYIESPALVERYNKALESLGLTPTKRFDFHIDGMGWSPELSKEQGTLHYLSHGPANPLALILTPDQRGKPLMAPFHSFDWTLMQAYFERFSKEIADITKDACIALDLDQGLSHYSTPQDLLLIRNITVHSSAGDLSSTAQAQAKLVATFKEEGLAWFDDKLRERIIDSARTYGDLRSRMTPPDVGFNETENFYADVFGGVFVLRPKGNAYLILQEKESFDMLQGRSRNAMYLGDPELLEQLLGEGLVDLDLDFYRKNIDKLKEKLHTLLIDILVTFDSEIDLTLLNDNQLKQRLRMLGGNVPGVYFELEQLIAKLEGGMRVALGDLSPQVLRLLLHPHASVTGMQRNVVWQLLLRLEPSDIKRLYLLDKQHFFELYESWPEAKKAWAEAFLK